MDDFERDFIAQVRSSDQTPAAQKEVLPKKPIDKRWFLLGGLIVLLIATAIVTAIISSSKNSGEDFTLVLDKDNAYNDAMSGNWRCSSTLGPAGDESEADRPEDLNEIMLSGTDLAEISFLRDGTYIFQFSNGDTEGGTYEQQGNRLELTTRSFSSGGKLHEGLDGKNVYDLFSTTDGKVALTVGEGATTAYVCE